MTVGNISHSFTHKMAQKPAGIEITSLSPYVFLVALFTLEPSYCDYDCDICIASPTGRQRAHCKTITSLFPVSVGTLKQKCFQLATKSRPSSCDVNGALATYNSVLRYRHNLLARR